MGCGTAFELQRLPPGSLLQKLTVNCEPKKENMRFQGEKNGEGN